MPDERLHIAVGVIFNSARDKVLISRRQEHVHQGGLWEFPGGKCQSGEDIRNALLRELQEELGLYVDRAQPFLQVEHDYQKHRVKLDVWCVYQWHGNLSGKEGQLIEWVDISLLNERQFPEANSIIIESLLKRMAGED